MFHISGICFEAIQSDIGSEDIHFFMHITDKFGRVGPCMEARMMQKNHGLRGAATHASCPVPNVSDDGKTAVLPRIRHCHFPIVRNGIFAFSNEARHHCD
jgi:hypothetical protein